MKIKLIVLFLIFNFAVILNAKASEFSLSAAFVGMSMDYREYGVSDKDGYGVYNAPQNMDKILNSEKSNFNEIRGGDFGLDYKHFLETSNYLNLSLNLILVAGETEYVGSYIGSPFGYGSVVGTTQDIILDTSIELSYAYAFSHKIEFSYGLGLGYRSWRRELSPSQVEEYKWYSIRPVLGLEYYFSHLSIAANVEYQYGVLPKMTLLQNTAHSDIDVNLGGANILQFRIPLRVKMTEQISLCFEYVYENQIIDKSNQVVLDNSYLWEPRSEANNQYIKLGATLKF